MKARKQHRIVQNNKAENAERREHTCHPGDAVMIKTDPSRKLKGERWTGPHTASVVCDNGTSQLSKAAPAGGGAVSQVWNIRQVKPC